VCFERQQIGRILAGDRQAAHAFVEDWAPDIKIWIKRRVPHDDVDDYCQFIWEHLAGSGWKVLSSWSGLGNDNAANRCNLAAYLRVVVDHRVTDLWRKTRNEPAFGEEYLDGGSEVNPDKFQTSPDHAEWNRRLSELDRALSTLAQNDRDMLVLSAHGFTYREIADRLGTNPNNVGVRLNQLRRRLRERLIEQLPGDFHNV